MIRVVVGIIQRDKTILINQRPLGKPYSGYWEFPGGKIEKDESAYEALKRELQEELGIDVCAAHSLFTHEHAYPDKTVLLDIWLVTAFNGEPESKENQVLAWVLPSDLNKLALLEGNWQILNKIKQLNSFYFS